MRECHRCEQEERKQLKEQLEETLADHHAAEMAGLRAEAAARHAELEGKVAAVEDQCLQAQTASDCEQRLVSSERLHSCPPLQLGRPDRSHGSLDRYLACALQALQRAEELEGRNAELESLVARLEAEAEREDSRAVEEQAKVEEQLLENLQLAKAEAFDATQALGETEQAAAEVSEQLSELEASTGAEMEELQVSTTACERLSTRLLLSVALSLQAELADESRQLMQAQLELKAAEAKLASAAATTGAAQAAASTAIASRYRVIAAARVRAGCDASSADMGVANVGEMLYVLGGRVS
eukprot:COSAG04_NODE_6269_length_1369_cov_1.078740_3_plen_297_part_01